MSDGIKSGKLYPVLSCGLGSGLVIVTPGCGNKDKRGWKDYYDSMATTPHQTHSVNVKVIERIFDRDTEDTDALVTFKDDVAIGVRTADCVPVLMYAEDVNGVAAVHAGWKGTLGGIVDNTLDVLEGKGADLSKLKVAFGPSISAKNYEVDAELAGRFAEAGFEDYVSWPNGKERKPHLDLQGVNMERLRRRGVKEENIVPSQLCTFDSKDDDGNYLFPSYRRENGTSDRLLTCISLLNRDVVEQNRRRWQRLMRWANEITARDAAADGEREEKSE